MDRSVDSIGTCSLDVEASADLSDWSEASSGGTLRSTSVKTPSAADHHLPSYLSLACTVNGYSTTTNYDPERLARSRDASPHRIDHEHLTPRNQVPTYSVHNNLLSPPNLVPLPTHVKPKMGDRTLTHQQHRHHQEYYRSTKSVTYVSSKESHFASSIITSQDTIDGCFDNGRLGKAQCVTFENKSLLSNGQAKCISSSEATSIQKESYSNGTTETKSFIQQRVERLYGPGALAQGFFKSPRKKITDGATGAESTHTNPANSNAETLNGSPPSNRLLKNGPSESPMKQSTSTPTLPVLRHLRPEFRAQLPILSPRKSTENSVPSSMQKSSTVPTFQAQAATASITNGHAKQMQEAVNEVIAEESGEKDGHYFLKIQQNEANRLLKLADKVELELEDEGLSEEVVGKIRSASGKARLLVSQKMQQFKGLCTNNITQVEGEAFPTTNEDLQGFWDMVMLQVHQVDALFKEIDTMKANNWEEVKPVITNGNSTANGKPKRVVSRVRPTSAASEEVRKQREAQRKQLIEERRKAMKAANQTKPVQNIEIFVPESS